MSAHDATLPVIGWDVGGAHVKACRLERGAVADVAQWPCPLWQGLSQLAGVLDQAGRRWPDLQSARHAVTMTGELVDLFAHRQEGVERIAALMAGVLPAPRFFAGDAGWRSAAEAGDGWELIASANWLATALHAAQVLGDSPGVLVDIGSTTTDLVAFARGRVLGTSRTDAERLATGELVYQGVVRTPLCALAQRIGWRGERLNVMNEFFSTAADVYRLTGELEPAHDQYPSADNGAKDAAATRCRLARMIGLDGRDGSHAEWLAFARAWRACQVAETGEQLARVVAAQRLPAHASIVGAGCGAFLVDEVAAAADLAGPVLGYGRDIVRIRPDDAGDEAADELAAWVRVCAPAVAVATLWREGQR